MGELNAVRDLDTLLELILERGREVLEAEHCTVFLDAPEEGILECRATTSETSFRIPRDVGLAGWVLAHREIVNVEDAYADPRFHGAVDQETGFRTRTLLTAPLESVEGRPRYVIGEMSSGTPYTARAQNRPSRGREHRVSALVHDPIR